MNFHRYTKEYEELQIRFVADVMQASVDEPTVEQQVRAARTYLASLQPRLTDADAALSFRAEFPLFDHVDYVREEAEVESANVFLSPATERFFRARLRKQGVNADTT